MSWKDPDGIQDANAYEVTLGGPAENWLEVTDIYSSGPESDLVYNAVLSGTPDDENLDQNDLSFTLSDMSEGDDVELTEYYFIPINSVNDEPAIVSYDGPTDLEEDGSLVLTNDDFNVIDPDNSPLDMILFISPGQNYTVNTDLNSILPDSTITGQ